MKNHFLQVVQEKVAVSSIGPSALRGQGGGGVVRAARNYCRTLNLRKLTSFEREQSFVEYLDIATKELTLSSQYLRWGAARKSLNLFLRDTLYNTYLNKAFRLNRIESWLEIPLDSVVAKGLRSMDDREELPAWPGLKQLSPEISSKYQEFARRQTDRLGTLRVHLDMYLWLSGRTP